MAGEKSDRVGRIERCAFRPQCGFVHTDRLERAPTEKITKLHFSIRYSKGVSYSDSENFEQATTIIS